MNKIVKETNSIRKEINDLKSNIINRFHASRNIWHDFREDLAVLDVLKEEANLRVIRLEDIING